MREHDINKTSNKTIAEDLECSTPFLTGLLEGLSSSPKYISSKFLYDKEGDRLFQEKMASSSYYLTNSEFEILTKHKNALWESFSKDVEHFQLIELGAGDGYKTKILLNYFLTKDLPFSYFPIDISYDVIEQLKTDLLKKLPSLKIKPIVGDYFEGLKEIPSNTNTRKVVLFLGSTIGNILRDKKIPFLCQINKLLNVGDMMMIGFDLKKTPRMIRDAYVLSTNEAFSKNVLTRANKELGCNFNLNHFEHHFEYEPITGLGTTFLVSTKKQNVYLPVVDQEFSFEAWEPITVTVHQKYDNTHINNLAKASGFEVVQNFYDAPCFFVDSIWQKQ